MPRSEKNETRKKILDNKTLRKILKEAKLAAKESLNFILEHEQPSEVVSCILLLGGRLTLDQDYLELIWSCDDLTHAGAALDTLAKGGIAGKKEVRIVLEGLPKVRQATAYALLGLSEVGLLTDEFEEEVEGDSTWGGVTRLQR